MNSKEKENYAGPRGLGTSKYASREIYFMPFPSASSHSQASNGTIATKEQIAATAPEMAPQNPGAQLAIAQNEALREEVDQHTAAFTSAVNESVTNTRKVLTLLREEAKKGPVLQATLDRLDALWTEMEKMLAAASEAKDALPAFLTKQSDNMSLFHNAKIAEAMHDNQEEVNLLRKKVDTQHSLILDQQQGIKAYQAKMEPQVDENKALQERVSRLTLTNGLLNTELDQAKIEIASVKTELDKSGELLAKATSDRDVITRNLEAEMQSTMEARVKASENCSKLKSRIEELVACLDNAKKETAREKNENQTVNQKFKDQTVEYARLHAEAKELREKVSTLTKAADAFKKRIAELEQDLGKHEELKKANATLSESNSGMKKQLDAINHQLSDAAGKIQRLETDNHKLEFEHKALVKKAAEAEQVVSDMAALKEENVRLQTTVKELELLEKKSDLTATDQGAEEALKKKNAELEGSLYDWQELAKRSYAEYKKVAEENEFHRTEIAAKDSEIQTLRNANVSTQSQSNGDAPAESLYWKNKYEQLMRTIG